MPLPRKYLRRVFVTSAIITLLVFLAGVGLGYWLDRSRVSDVLGALRQNELDLESFLVERQFVDALGGDSCAVLEPRFRDLAKNLGVLGRTLTQYEAKRIFAQIDYDYLKARYSVLEIRTYLLLLELQKRCTGQPRAGILFFYKVDDENSIRQGYVLDAIVQRYGESRINVYSFDRDFKVEPIDLLERHYNVTSSPALVINNRIVKNSFVSREELEKLLKETAPDVVA